MATTTATPSSTTTTSTPGTKLQWVNIANVIAYVINVLVTYGVGMKSNSLVSASYQTLVTPAGFAFAIWGVIFIAQLIWVIVQLLPSYRSKELVIHGVSFYYIIVCLVQSVWTVLFTRQQITLSLIAIVGILLPLLKIYWNLSKIAHTNLAQYFLLKFPFEIHASWVLAATVVSVNVVLVALKVSARDQVIAAWSSLLFLAIVAVYATLQRLFMIPLVLSWATFWVAMELRNPKDTIVNTFASKDIHQIMAGSSTLAAAALLLSVVVVVNDTFRKSSSSTARASEPTTTTYSAMDN